jgi:hypothetical protein
MKITTPAHIVDSTGKSSEEIVKQIQAIADDVRGILAGGLSFQSKQLPFELRSVMVTSGTPIILTMAAPYTIKGCHPINTNGSTITNFVTNVINDQFTCTITCSPSPTKMVLMMTGVR